MALTPSHMMPLGTHAPDFSLVDTVSGKTLTLRELKGLKGTLVMFICNHCPYVKHLQSALGKLGMDYQHSGISMVAINSNDVTTYPDDSPEKMRAFAEQNRFIFPYLFDATQTVAKAYQAACTPDFFLFDKNLRCVYRGQFDDSRPDSEIAIDGRDLRAAMDALFNDDAVNPNQKPSVGCNIKWKNTK